MANKYYFSENEKTAPLKATIVFLWIALVVLLLFGVVFTAKYINDVEKQHRIDNQPANVSEYFVNILLCVEDETKETDNLQALLIGFDTNSKAITVTQFNENVKLTATDRTESATAYELFEIGTASYVSKTIENSYGIKIDRYITCTLSEVEKIVDSLGGVDYNIETAMQFKNKDGALVTNLVKGKQKLNGNQYCQYLRYDNWKSSEQKAEKQEALFLALINQYNKSLKAEDIVSIYKKISNKLTTNVTIIEVNDFALKFEENFSKINNPAISADVDFSDAELSKVKIKNYYEQQ